MAATPQIFDLPAEINSLIFSSLSLKDIGRLRRCCSAWNNNLYDLSFLTVLDFSYSPNITKQAFQELISKRINAKKNNIWKVTIYHATNLEDYWLEYLFKALPRLTHVRIGFLPAKWLRLVLQLEYVEDVSYRAVPMNDSEKGLASLDSFINLFEQWEIRVDNIKCTKLKRLKLQDLSDFYCDRDALAKMNPALNNDVHFKKFVEYDAKKRGITKDEESTKQLDNCLKWYKQRPFLEFLLADHVARMHALFVNNREKFDEELNHWLEKLAPVPLPSGIRPIYARILASQHKYKEAYDQYFSLLDPNFKMTFDQTIVDDPKNEPYFGAYHMAKDYLNSPELLQRLKEVNPHNYEMIATQYTTLQKYYDANQQVLLNNRQSDANVEL